MQRYSHRHNAATNLESVAAGSLTRGSWRRCAGDGIATRSAGFTANHGGSHGNLCLSGGIGRMVLSLFVPNAEGRGAVTVDLTAMREPNGYVAAVPGERWYFQAWYRDSVAGMATSNFTSASAVLLD